jgi:hypothetical protein
VMRCLQDSRAGSILPADRKSAGNMQDISGRITGTRRIWGCGGSGRSGVEDRIQH